MPADPNLSPSGDGISALDQLPISGIELIKQFTQCRLQAYPTELVNLSGKSVYLAGWGSSARKNGQPFMASDRLTQAEANELLCLALIQDLLPALVGLPHWPQLNTNQQGALLSFGHSLGADHFPLHPQLPLCRALQAYRWHEIPGILKRYHGPHPGHNIIRRRQKEAALFQIEPSLDGHTVINRSRLLELTTPRIQGEDVRLLQQALVRQGYEIDLDGVFGPLTQWALEKYQAAIALPVNGIADVETQRVLHARPLYYQKPCFIGSDVREVQTTLVQIGYDVYINGIFEHRTERAVLAFQRYLHLPEDGIVQGLTLSQLLYLPVLSKAS